MAGTASTDSSRASELAPRMERLLGAVGRGLWSEACERIEQGLAQSCGLPVGQLEDASAWLEIGVHTILLSSLGRQLGRNLGVEAAAREPLDAAASTVEPVIGQMLAEQGIEPAGELRALREAAARLAPAVPPARGGEECERLIYAHEQLLAATDPHRRRGLGAYYTPPEVVDYLVRAALELNPPQPETRILDPACGAGVFLARILREQAAAPAALLGCEVLPVSWAAAHLLLKPFATTGRCRITLGNALDGPLPDASLPDASLTGASLAGARDLILVGNPPYANFGRRNRSPWIRSLLADYKQGLQERKQNLNDDCIKFLRWAQHSLDSVGAGVLAFITSNTYLEGLTHRVMRSSLLQSFDEIFVLNLNGSQIKRRNEKGAVDENIFGIRSGVAIAVFVKRRDSSGPAVVRYAELWGERSAKLAALASWRLQTTPWQELRPDAPAFFLAPVRPSAGFAAARLNEVFREYSSGVQTKRDDTFVGFSRKEVSQKVQAFLAELQSNEQLRKRWLRSRYTLSDLRFDASRIRPYVTGPFEERFVYYDPRLLGRARAAGLQGLLQGREGLVFMRQSTNAGEYDHFLSVREAPSDRAFTSGHGAPFVASLWRMEQGRRLPNLSDPFLQQLAAALGRSFVVDEDLDGELGEGGAEETEETEGHTVRQVGGRAAEAAGQRFTAREVLAYLYGMFHHPEYRRRFAEDLRTGFPPVPLPAGAAAFDFLAGAGEQLLQTHLDWRKLPPAPLRWVGPDPRVARGYPRWECPAAEGGDHALELNPTTSLIGVPACARQWRVGGYEVLTRWLRVRRGRDLRDSLAEFGRIVTAAVKTKKWIAVLSGRQDLWRLGDLACRASDKNVQ